MLYYSLITIFLAAVDAYRMKITWGKVGNLNHWISYLLAFIGMAGLWIAINGLVINWQLLPFVVGCAALRGLFYDLTINIGVNFFITPRAIGYISASSNSLNEDRLTKIGFWYRRAGFAVLLAGVLIINHFVK